MLGLDFVYMIFLYIRGKLVRFSYHFLTSVLPVKSCKDWRDHGFIQVGVYFLSTANSQPFPVYCDQTTDGGGWTVLQRRKDGSVDFYRNWDDYKAGFGHLFGEFWLGNDVIHTLTTIALNELRVELEDFNGTKVYAKYSNFTISNEKSNYTLLTSGYSGTAGDSFGGGTGSPDPSRLNNRMPFTTRDRDHDNWASGNCAVAKQGAWWFNDCYWSHLNGPYKNQGEEGGINWYSWTAVNYKTLKRSEMKIRPLY